ncbi:MAG: PQQ-binding-like beta-propeller repeat protein, partial [Chitinivibrionales bacterium]|nr:PQQ-binding-like beta-propeller repeat protein [Chitinivibrionales bacterium]MBD3355878.1 PQQ-binding-like beta-propeller repeat protein [Chitinivibrionales bacterium]
MRMKKDLLAAALTLLSASLCFGDLPGYMAIRDATQFRRGLVVVVGCDDAQWLHEFSEQANSVVQALHTDISVVQQMRNYLSDRGAYGRISVKHWRSSDLLPYHDNLINLVVAENSEGINDEIVRVLAPNGKLYHKQGAGWTVLEKPRPSNIDDWTHYTYDASGNPVSSDSVAGAPHSLQWITSPRYTRSHDYMASVTGCVSAGGRLFYIVDLGSHASIHYDSRWKLYAVDAFNGMPLWEKDILEWEDRYTKFLSTPRNLARSLVAHDSRVFTMLSIHGPVVALDAEDGTPLVTYEGTHDAEEIVYHNDVLLIVTRDRSDEGKQEYLKAFDATTGNRLWQNSSQKHIQDLSVAAKGDYVVYNDHKTFRCVDLGDGEEYWSKSLGKGNNASVLIHGDVVLFCNQGDGTQGRAKTAF